MGWNFHYFAKNTFEKLKKMDVNLISHTSACVLKCDLPTKFAAPPPPTCRILILSRIALFQISSYSNSAKLYPSAENRAFQPTNTTSYSTSVNSPSRINHPSSYSPLGIVNAQSYLDKLVPLATKVHQPD